MEKTERILADIVGKNFVSTQGLELWVYSRDFSPEFPKIPAVVVMPETTEQVAEIVKHANKTKTPIWPRAGGTSCCKGSMPQKDGGIVLDLTRMTKVLDISEEDMTATVQPGIVLRTLEEEMRKKNLHPMNLGSCGSGLAATVGAGIATNAEGWGGAEFGNYSEQVVCLEVVLPTGEILRTGSDSTTTGTKCERYVNGPDLAGLFCGSQGFLGIITEATIKALPAPEKVEFSTPVFKTLEQLTKASMAMTRERLVSAAVSMAGKRTMKGLVSPEMEDEGMVFVVIQGREEEVAYKKKLLDRIIVENGGMDLGGQITKEQYYDADLFWPISAALKFGRYAAGCNIVPYTWLPAFVERAERFFYRDNEELTKESGIVGPFIFPSPGMGRASMVNVIYYDETDPKRWEQAVGLWKKWLRSNIENGGGAYWIGSSYGEPLVTLWRESTYNLMKTLKRVMDPNNIMNPGLFGDI